MPEKLLYEYAVIRIVPRVEREEFLNVGVIVYCTKRNFLQAKIGINYQRLQVFCCGELDIHEVEANLKALERICIGGKASGPIGVLDIASRFRWLTATRSTVVQCSKVHPGFCSDPEDMLNKLFDQLVL